ncbi:methyltransferase domain-containing protein [Methylosinus sp. LW3]|uniref:class I SAM-dependent methyltransferase n=1 Tax=Methylosinus sp. LW3 TaxID=107635 RepID=UPI000A0508FE|nr:methyltransferase domain-containing protein [Methylosinus sp. LW3]
MIDNAYLRGDVLFGDDLSPSDIEKWHADEERGYYELVHSVFFKDSDYVYEYAALNEHYGYRPIRGRHYRRALALGCARGDDVAPIADNVDEFLAVEPAEKWWSRSIGGKSARYVKPTMTGEIPCGAGEIDLTICLGVLHHIPNATRVINEISRVSATNAHFILREPISTMGDWTKPRVGLTKNERGLPVKWLDKTLSDAGFVFERRAFCMFPLTGRLANLLGGGNAYSNPKFVAIDKVMSAAMSWNYYYHRDRWFKKIAPSCAFYILRKI